MPFFSRFRNRDGAGAATKSKKQAHLNGTVAALPPKPRWDDAWLRKDVEPEEVQELLRGCTMEIKSRALDMPFLLLPFRPASDLSAARNFIRNFFNDDRGPLRGESLTQELLLTEPLVLCSVMKWCWSRLAGGVVTWEAYELFRIGEQDSDMARDAFATFIPISIESEARTKIIFDFFDLMAAIAAHGKSNGMGGRKLSRLAGWWAFEQVDNGNGFDGGYKSWSSAADATCHLFFAYLRSLSPDSIRGVNSISALPRSLQALVGATEYPPEQVSSSTISKVVMIVDRVSPTPFALLRRAKHFEYRDDDKALQEFSDYDDPVQALTEECRRVLKSISSTNQSAFASSKAFTSLRDPDAEWSRFTDLGFGSYADELNGNLRSSELGKNRKAGTGPMSAPQSKANDMGRPTTPSWADFLSSGFVDDTTGHGPAPLLLPPDKVLPPIDTRQPTSSQSDRPVPVVDLELEPGELASINTVRFDDVFWWVWIGSLAGEETADRKAVFGRCALIETDIHGGRWLLFEEMVKGAAPEPELGAYIAEKKSRNPFSKRSRLGRTKTSKKSASTQKPDPSSQSKQTSSVSKSSIGTDQHARIQAAAAALQRKQKDNVPSPRRGRMDDATSTKTNSVFTLQPVILNEAGPAMKWANTYDKNAIRAKYLGDQFAGKGSATDLASGINGTNGSITPVHKKEQPLTSSHGFSRDVQERQSRDLPALPPDTPKALSAEPQTAPLPPLPATPTQQNSNLPITDAAETPLPAATPAENVNPLQRKPVASVEQAAQVPLPAATPAETGRSNLPEGVQDSSTLNLAESSPESKKRPAKKLKKKEPGGFKGIFGRKKPGPTTPTSPQPADSLAVAAARAALDGTPPKANYVAPGGANSSLGRRLSGIGRKKSPAVLPKASPSVPTIQDLGERASSPPVYNPQPRIQDRFDAQNRYDSQASISHTSSFEQHEANREFRRFDQGPVDQPAFVPTDSPPLSSRPSSRTATPTERAHSAEGITSSERPVSVEPSVSSESEDDRPPSPVKDRWAQIRKNAAERAEKAAGQSEDQSAVSGADKTDDGEESPEESESSVVAPYLQSGS
ncbi:MAG: hypothetical protein LQ351_000606 [Letrouitia transgressa]|nr:MAG: hypothetical protein LQ351_000606 [Letrouitia transgressa]